MTKQYVHFGCNLVAPKEWINFDNSPTLRIQRIPLIGKLVKNKLNLIFPENVRYGDIIKGLPIEHNSCDGLYCSHTLEHLSLQDFRISLQNCYQILKKNGVFRIIVPDLEFAARSYINDLDNGNNLASLKFMGNDTLLGISKRPRGLKNILSLFFGNTSHLWMWDSKSLSEELKNIGFTNTRVCKFNDSIDPFFKLVEDESRFENAVAIECSK